MVRRSEIGSPSLGGRVLWHQLRSAPGLVALIFATTLVTSGFITAAPRVLERVAEEDLRRTLVDAEPEQRNISVTTLARLGAGPEDTSVAAVTEDGDKILAETFPDSVRETVDDAAYVVDSPSFRVTSFPDDRSGPFPTTFRFRFQEDIEERMTLVSGTMPDTAEPIPILVGEDCPEDRLSVAGFVAEEGTVCAVEETTVLETALTRETADALDVDSGDSFLVRPEGQERLWYMHGVPDETQTWLVTVSGIIALSDTADEFWYADTALHRPRIVENPDFRLVFAAGLVPADLYDDVLAAVPTASFEYSWRYFVDPQRVDAARADELIADVAEIAPAIDGDVITSLPELLLSHLEQRTTTITLTSVAGVTLLLVAIGVILVLADVYAARRAGDTTLIRDRGASLGQLTVNSMYTGLLLVVPATVLGYMITALTLSGTRPVQPGRGAFLLTLGGVAGTLVAMTPQARRRRLGAGRSDRREVGAATRRVVFEVFVVTAAVVSVALLRRRGLADSPQEGFDLLLAVTPALVGVAVGLLAVRALGPLTRLVEWLGRRRQSVVRYVGLGRLRSLSGRARVPLVMVVTAVALAVLSATVRVSIADGQAAHSWQMVGGDVRVEARDPGSPLAFDPGDPDQMGAAAEGVLFPDTLVIGGGGAPRLNVLAIDVPAYREVLAGSPVDEEVFAALDRLEGPVPGGPAPVVISESWGNDPPSPGSPISIDLGAVDPNLTVVATVPHFPSLDPGRPFAVISLEMLRSLRGELSLPATVILMRVPPPIVEEIAESAGVVDSRARVISRYEVAADVTDDPFVAWTDRGLAAIFYLSAGFAVLAALAYFVATAWNRRSDLGLLRILGLTTRQATAITGLEQAVPLSLGAVLGGLAGVAVPTVLAPRFDIGPFTGGTVPGQLAVDWMSLALVVAVIALVMAAALSAYVVITRSVDPISSLSLGDE